MVYEINNLCIMKPFPKQAFVITFLHYKSFENTTAPFPTVFSIHFENFISTLLNLELSSANSFSLEESNSCCLESAQ